MAYTKVDDFSIKDMPSLAGFVAIVTGGSGGIGYVTSLHLAVHGARVYIMSRSSQKASEAISSMKQSTPDKELDLNFSEVDLQSLDSVNEAIQKFKATESRLDILINNAAIMAIPYALTRDGYETQWQTNYLSPYFLIKSLLPLLSSSAAGSSSRDRVRIVNVASDAVFVPLAPDLDLENPNLDYIKGIMSTWKRYCHSKLALVLLTHHLHTLFKSQDISIKAYALHPGVFESNLQTGDPTIFGTIVKYSVKWGLVPGKLGREDGARTTLACATSGNKEIVEGSGAFFRPFGRKHSKGEALFQKWQSEEMGEKLWQASERMLKEKGFDA